MRVTFVREAEAMRASYPLSRSKMAVK